MPIKIIEEKVCRDLIIFIDQVVFMIILRPFSFSLLHISPSIIRQIENGSVVRISNSLIVTKHDGRDEIRILIYECFSLCL